MKKRTETHKKIAAVVIAAGFIIVQECFILMYLCIRGGYTATAAWLTAAVGLAEAVIGVGANCYFNLAKSDHSEGGITFEAAKAQGFKQSTYTDSPPI